LTTSSAQLRGSINPNNSFASAWFEWGTSTNYGSTSRILATDTMEGLNAFNLAGGSVSGGAGFGSYSRYGTFGNGAGTFLANNSSNQTIDGAKSLGAYAGTAAGVSFRRSVSTTRQFGSMLVSARFNVDNAKGFSGFNLKSANGSGASGFGAGELVSFGVAPAGGNNGILVTDSSGQRVLDLGADVRNTILDFKVDFDARNRRYVVGAKFRTNSSFTRVSGTMSGTGTNVTHVGFANWNSTGAFQDLMVDSLQVLGSTALGGGTNAIVVSNPLSGLPANTLYHYRVASMNLDGGISYGENATFYTGIDLAVAAANTGAALMQGGAGEFTVTVSNVGASTSSGNVVVSSQLPAGLTMTSMSGTGWTFNSNNLTATRSSTAGAGTSFPPITIGVAVASNAPASLTTAFAVSGGGDGNVLNNTSSIASSVTAGPDLVIGKSSDGALTQGGTGSFTLLVSNAGGGATAGAVTVTETPPAGMTISSMSGTGWTFNANNSTVARSDALAAGGIYPAVTVSVAIATNAAAALTNTATVAGGGDVDGSDNSAQVAVSIAPQSTLGIETWRQTYFGSSANSGQGADTNVVTSDGIPNLMKYALGLNPTNAAPVADQPSVSGNLPFSITFRRARDASDVAIVVQGTDNVSGGWTNIWSSVTNAFGGGTNPYEIITVTDPVPPENVPIGRFFRLNVTRP
jgi:uncharacterized repeat protein (TIGR01451 family)